MRRNKPQYKRWVNLYAKRIWFKRHIRKIIHKKRKKRHKINVDKCIVPQNFSLSENFEECIEFFSSLKNRIRNKNYKYDVIFLDMSKVINLTADSLMFLLAFLHNTKSMVTHDVNFRGNLPENEMCKSLVKRSGFLNYLNTNIVSEEIDSTISILKGNDSSGTNLYDIMQKVAGSMKTNLYTKRLYTVLGEIISNSVDHAYDENDTKWAKWLIFAEQRDNIFNFVILDTGEGILKTICRKVHEKLLGNPLKLLESALSGSILRTKTREKWRGKGLKIIKRAFDDKKLFNLELNTNNVKYTCTLDSNNKVVEDYKLLNNDLLGTLYKFDFILGR